MIKLTFSDEHEDLMMCVGHSVDLSEEHIIMDAKPKIENYIQTRLEREQQIIGKHLKCYIIDAIKSNPSGTLKSEVYNIVYGSRNLNENLKQSALKQIDHHVIKLQKEGVVQVSSSDDDALYQIIE